MKISFPPYDFLFSESPNISLGHHNRPQDVIKGYHNFFRIEDVYHSKF